MDWSDDVAYSVHDVEDAIASRRLDPRRLRDADDVAGVLAVAVGVYAPDLTTDDLGAALDRLLGHRGGARGIRRVAARPRRAEGHHLAAHRPLRPGRRGRDPRSARRRDRMTRHAADLVVPDADPGRVRRPQGGGRPLRHVRRGAGGRSWPGSARSSGTSSRRTGPTRAARPRPAGRPRRRRLRRRGAAGRRRPGGLAHRRPGPRAARPVVLSVPPGPGRTDVPRRQPRRGRRRRSGAGRRRPRGSRPPERGRGRRAGRGSCGRDDLPPHAEGVLEPAAHRLLAAAVEEAGPVAVDLAPGRPPSR